MQKSSFTKLTFLIWLSFCIVLFIYIPSRVDFIHGFSIANFPLTPQKFERFHILEFTENLLGSFFVVLLFSLAYSSLGSFLLHLILRDEFPQKKPTLPSWLALLCTTFLIGHAAFSVTFIALGTMHLFTSVYVISALAVGFIIGFPWLRRAFFGFPATKGLRLIDELNGPGNRKFFYLSAGILLLGLIYSSSRLSYDAVAVYFSDEKLTALTDRIQFFQNNSFVASSFQSGISYAALIKIYGDQAARMYSWINGVVILIFTLAIGEKVGLSKQARLISLILLLTSTAFFDLTGDGKIDLISTAFAIAAVYWMIGNIAPRTIPEFFLVGVLSGLSIVSRPFNIFLVCLFIGIYYLIDTNYLRGVRLSKTIQSMLWLGTGIVCMIASHILVNWAILGDPLAFLKDLHKVNSADWQWTFDPQYLWLFRLLYPITVSILNLPQSNGNITPLFVGFLPGLLIKEIRERTNIPKKLMGPLIAATLTLVTWITLLFTIFEIRYVLFLWAILFLALATVIESFLLNTDIFLKGIIEFAIIALAVFMCGRTLYIAVDTYSPVDKSANPHCYDHDLCSLLEPINKMAAPGDRVLILNAFRYYLRTDLLACSSKHEEYQVLQELTKKDPIAFWNEVYREGYKYVTFEINFSQRHLGFGIIPSPMNTPDWIKLKPLYGKPGEYVVSYQIQVENPPFESERVCRENEKGIWEVVDKTGG